MEIEIISDNIILKEKVKNGILKCSRCKLAVFQFDIQQFSEIIDLSIDDSKSILEQKLDCLFTYKCQNFENGQVYEITREKHRFHPKVFFFENENGWEAIVSSANITYGFGTLLQSSVYISDKEKDCDCIRKQFDAFFDECYILYKKNEKSKKSFSNAVSSFFNIVEECFKSGSIKFYTERDWLFLSRFVQGETDQTIGDQNNLTHQRVNQIVKRAGGRLLNEIKKLKKQNTNTYNSLKQSYEAIQKSVNGEEFPPYIYSNLIKRLGEAFE